MNILGYEYTIIEDESERNLEAFGKLYAAKQIIKIAADLGGDQYISTLLHEILEAINFHLVLGFDNNVIGKWETALYQVFTANGVDLMPLVREIIKVENPCKCSGNIAAGRVPGAK